MQDIYQKTLSENVTFEGIGLHTGKKSVVKILPSNADTGILFKRVDLSDKNLIQATFTNVTSAKLCTTLENEYGAKVSTVEHLLAAFYISGIDNAVVEINNEEVPIMDGSSKDFLDIFKKTKLIDLPKKRKYLKILNKIELVDGKRKIIIEPQESSFKVNFQLDYNNKVIGNQKNTVDFQKDNLDDVSNSRTFCLYEDIEKIKKLGFAKGGSLDNALVVDSQKVLNKNGLRNKKEFVNHKILDLAGDFLLSGYRIIGKVSCNQGGHELTNMFLRKLLNQKKNFTLVENNDVNIVEKTISTYKTDKIAVNA